MVFLTSSFPEREVELDKLVMFVHWYQHNDTGHEEPRIGSWIATISIGRGDTKSVALTQRQIKKAVSSFSAMCMGIAETGERAGPLK